ncbi:MAG: DbpA RNA binding domain-containing protein, partial [Candidatus Methanomethylophilaceae archaeon]|nr:DbpA RNA binding domain-containing protein [Candidatus Methanomethylophilaceae archaeon]
YEAYMDRKIERVTRKQIQKLQIANPELKAIRHDREPEEQKPKREKVKVRAVIRKDAPKKDFFDITVLSLDIGKSSGTSRNEIVGYITSCSGIGEESIGRIGISTSSSFVEVDSTLAGEVMKAVNKTKLNGKKVHAQFAPEKTKCKDKLKKAEKE